jgi:hypothetical protein
LLTYLLDCDDGTFGDGCLLRCHCQSGFCDKISGICPDKLCLPGWIGDSCSEGIYIKQFPTAPYLELSLEEEFEDTKGIIRIRISKKNRQHDGQKKKYKRTNNDLQNIHIKLKIE